MRLLVAATVASTLEAFLLPFGEHFRGLGWQVDALANGATTSSACQCAFDNVWDASWNRQPLDFRNLSRPARQIRSLVQERHYDIVHVHTPVAAFVTRYALRGLRAKGDGPKIIYTAHGFHFYEDPHGLHNRRFVWLEKLAGHWTDYLVVINREDEAAARKYHVVPDDRVAYIPGIGIDTKRYDPAVVSETDIRQTRQELKLTEKDRLFLLIAEFNLGKRHRDAIRALASLGHPIIHLAFAGTGPLLESMKNMAEALGVTGQVHFLGFRRDIPTLVRASVATLLPSEREGLPRSVMESLCLGVPVIGTDIRGMRDLLGNGGGLLVGVGRPNELAQAMSWVLEHPDEARLMGERGRQQMAAYDIQHILALHEDLYKRALNEESTFGAKGI